MFQTYAKLSKYNQKISKNLLHLAAIFYVANMDFYLSINRIAKVWDQNIQNDVDLYYEIVIQLLCGRLHQQSTGMWKITSTFNCYVAVYINSHVEYYITS